MIHLWLLFCLNSWLKSEAQGFGINLIKVPDDDRAQIVCTVALLGKYFHSGESLSGFVLHMSITSAASHVQQSLLQALHTDRTYPWTMVVNEAASEYDTPATIPQFIMHEKPQCYFIVIENMEDEDMDEMFENWKSNLNWNPLAQFVVYLSAVEETEEEMTDIMIEILLNFMNKKIYNVNIIGQSEESSYYYGKTVFPYHPDNNCGNRVISIETLDLCDYQESEKEEDNDEEDGDGDEERGEGDEMEEDEVVEDEVEVNEVDEEQEIKEQGKENYGHTKVEEEEIDKDNEEEKDVKNYSQDTFNSSVKNKESFTDTSYTSFQTTASSESEYINQTSSFLTSTLLKPTSPSKIKNIDKTSFKVSNIHQQPTIPFEIESIDKTSTTEDPFETTKASEIQHAEKYFSIHSSNPLQPTTEASNIDYVANTHDSLMEYKNISETQNSNHSIYPKLYIEELYRALFLDKFPRDLSGCPLVAAYRPWEPYIFNEALENIEKLENASSTEATNNSIPNSSTLSYSGEDNDGDNDYVVYSESQRTYFDGDVQTDSVEVRLNGIEYKMIQTIAERLHISIEIQVENTNLYHLFQQLIDGDIEMVVGGIDEDPSISQFVSSTVPYHQDDLTWCVAKANHTHNLFNFMTTFQSGAWILTLLFVLTASLNILVSQKFLELRMGYLKSYFSINIYVMGIILSQAIRLRPIPTCLKVCFGAICFMGLMFGNIYQSFLVSTLTTPKSSYQISQLQAIYQNRMQIMGSVDNVRHLNKEGEIYRYVREQFQMCYNIEECLQRAATDGKLAVAVSRQHSFYNPRIPRDHLYCFDRNENIYLYLVTMLMPKKFHLLHKINPVIQHIIESGHMQKWARDLDMRRKITEKIQRAREEPFKSLTIAQVGGSFVFHNILITFALFVFAMEHLVYWLVVKRKTRLKLAKLCHRKFV